MGRKMLSGYGETVCPRCGEKGRVGARVVRSSGRPYWYLIVKHTNGKVCVVRPVSREEVATMRQIAIYTLLKDSVDAISSLLSRLPELEEKLGWIGIYRLLKQLRNQVAEIERRAREGGK